MKDFLPVIASVVVCILLVTVSFASYVGARRDMRTAILEGRYEVREVTDPPGKVLLLDGVVVKEVWE